VWVESQEYVLHTDGPVRQEDGVLCELVVPAGEPT
jgi:hypothetical protein